MIPHLRIDGFRQPGLRLLLCLAATLPFLSCEKTGAPSTSTLPSSPVDLSPLDLVLTPHEGNTRSDISIREAQERVRTGHLPVPSMERLGWTYVDKARESFDPGYYLLAEACAGAIEEEKPDSEEAFLLRGHVFNQLHRFREAEEIARKLVDRRGIPFDYLLLGDALMEQGKLEEAIEYYQQGADMRPDLQSYARAGWMRWLLGDLPGAIEATRMAVGAGSPQHPESFAWCLTRLASFHFLAGEEPEAQAAIEAALELQPDYPPALLLRGRSKLASGEPSAALADLETAVERNPLPDYQWTLLEALASAGETDRLHALEQEFHAKAARIDPRTYSLYLATTGTDPDKALELAREELTERQDIFTHDAVAWALHACGRIDEAREHMDKAVAEFTEDGRLFLHAGVIAASAGETEEAREWHAAAENVRHTLLPSERQLLKNLGRKLAHTPPPATRVADGKPEDTENTTL